jgi:hypothetical protein
MKTRVARVSLMAVVCALIALPSFAESQARIVRLSFLNGAVEISRDPGQGFEHAIMNMPVTQGTQLKTGDGKAEVEFENGSTVRLTPETSISFDSLSLRDNGAKVSSIALDRGVAYFNLKGKDKNNFRLQLAGHDIEPKKSARFRVEMSSDQVRIAVFDGELNVQGPGKRVVVHKNQTFSFDPQDAAHYALAKGIDEYQFDTWDKERDQYQTLYARNSYGGGRGAPYYGWDDLNYYGAFSYFPGYGYMWRPYGVGYGWDPFSTGYWVSYPTFGYTWVSPYAWGWTPYRYGGWQFVPAYGWFWRPGPWVGWHRVPPVINPPRGFVAPRPPLMSRSSVVAVGNPVPAWRWNRSIDNDRPGTIMKGRIAPLPTPNIQGFSTVGNRQNQPTSRPMARRVFAPPAPARPVTPPPVRSVGPPPARSEPISRPMGGGSMGHPMMGGGSMRGGAGLSNPGARR